MPVHICPVCGVAHDVSPVRAQFAYGRQLTCNPDCEAERRRRLRAHHRRLAGLRPESARPWWRHDDGNQRLDAGRTMIDPDQRAACMAEEHAFLDGILTQ